MESGLHSQNKLEGVTGLESQGEQKSAAIYRLGDKNSSTTKAAAAPWRAVGILRGLQSMDANVLATHCGAREATGRVVSM